MKLSGFKTAIFLSILISLAFISGVSADTAINNVCEINKSGIYYLNNSITSDSGNIITITCSDVVLDGNGFYLDGNGVAEGGIYANGVTNVTIKDVTVQGFRYGIYLKYVDNSTLENNAANLNELVGIYLLNSTNNIVTYNNGSDNHLYLVLENSNNNTITNNTANSNGDYGIFLDSSDNNTITGNTANSNADDGIYLEHSHNNVLTGNTASLNKLTGIDIWYSNYNELTNNTANSNNDSGIYLAVSDNNVLTGNTANSNDDCGIQLDGSINNTFTGNTVSSNHENAIYMLDSYNNTFTGNTANSNEYGIDLDGSHNNTFTGNTANSNGDYGILIYDSENTALINNVFNESGMHIQSESNISAYWNTHTIENNTVNGKPIYYFKNNVGGTVPTDAGQVILTNCSGMNMENLNLSNTTTGLELGLSSGNNITNVTANSNFWEGIRLYYSDNNLLTGNTLMDNSNGISMGDSDNNALTGNTLMDNSNGIVLGTSNNNILTGNTANSNGKYGIYLSGSNNNALTGNTVNSNNKYGIYIMYSNNNNITENIANLNYYGMYLENSNANNIFNNTFNNTDNFAILNSTNYWNTSAKNGGGNRWFSNGTGFSETHFDYDGDGFCDPYYTLDGNNIDYLPIPLDPTTHSDTDVPDVTINSPIETTYYVNNIEINVTASDNISGISAVIAEIESFKNITLELDGDYYLGNTGNLSNGNYKITINATDWARKSNSAESVNFKILTPEIYDLTTENNENIGLVSIFVDEDILNFTYKITEPNWSISEIHLTAFNESPNDPASMWYNEKYLTKNGKVKTFYFNEEFDPSAFEASGTINLTEIPVDPSSKLYIAANAVVRKDGVKKFADAWANGTSISDRTDIMYVEYPLE
ncbi:parallel beta-helix repeat protein [Methanococcus maripaludis]|uniref:Parallel beta-helix repeat protein n=1 Tax=Methanococcus maripaludis TaxID=39152 RepID=A0A7J9NJ84_METMI|nr:right-handed parallel beta-helix repeat-containing protein [Methanococcus maripaludis]MBA2840986.1 parallel beta-helix repeat protein [Methanococcus maripaludis]